MCVCARACVCYCDPHPKYLAKNSLGGTAQWRNGKAAVHARHRAKQMYGKDERGQVAAETVRSAHRKQNRGCAGKEDRKAGRLTLWSACVVRRHSQAHLRPSNSGTCTASSEIRIRPKRRPACQNGAAGGLEYDPKSNYPHRHRYGHWLGCVHPSSMPPPPSPHQRSHSLTGKNSGYKIRSGTLRPSVAR